jgi:ankyrin repeat protein
LYWAALEGHTAVSKMLLRSGAQVNEKNNDGITPLHWAAENNGVSFFELLTRLNINSKVNELGALNEVKAFRKLLSSEIFDRNLLGLVLSYGDFNMNITDNRGKTALDIAREKGHSEIVAILEGIISTYENQYPML